MSDESFVVEVATLARAVLARLARFPGEPGLESPDEVPERLKARPFGPVAALAFARATRGKPKEALDNVVLVAMHTGDSQAADLARSIRTIYRVDPAAAALLAEHFIAPAAQPTAIPATE
jgi:hypothetical protein